MAYFSRVIWLHVFVTSSRGAMVYSSAYNWHVFLQFTLLHESCHSHPRLVFEVIWLSVARQILHSLGSLLGAGVLSCTGPFSHIGHSFWSRTSAGVTNTCQPVRSHTLHMVSLDKAWWDTNGHKLLIEITPMNWVSFLITMWSPCWNNHKTNLACL